MPWDFWLIFLVLGVLVPWRGRVRLKRLLAQPTIGTKEKLALYGMTIAFQWTLAGLVAWRAMARGLTVADLGLGRRWTADLVAAGFLGAALLAAFQWFNLRRLRHMTGPTVELLRKLAAYLLPRRPVEFGPYGGLAVTAGICEEFLYRGFAMAALSRAGMATGTVVLICSVLFGLAHAYQGKSGILGTTVLGFGFSVGRLFFNSLLPVILWHAAVDVAAGVAGPRFLLNEDQRALRS